MTPLDVGLTAKLELTVGEDDTADTFGSGDLPVLGTPRVVALLEEAACTAIADSFSPSETTVGTRMVIDHLAASAIGRVVTAEVTLTKIDDTRLHFEGWASDGEQTIARCQHVRVVVDRERFRAAAGV